MSFQICDIVSTPVTLKRVAIRCWWKGAAPGPWRVYGVGEDERVSKDYPYRSNPPVHMSLVEIQDEWEPSAYLELEVKYSDGFFRREAWGFKAKCSQNDAMELVIDGGNRQTLAQEILARSLDERLNVLTGTGRGLLLASSTAQR